MCRWWQVGTRIGRGMWRKGGRGSRLCKEGDPVVISLISFLGDVLLRPAATPSLREDRKSLELETTVRSGKGGKFANAINVGGFAEYAKQASPRRSKLRLISLWTARLFWLRREITALPRWPSTWRRSRPRRRRGRVMGPGVWD